MPNPFNSDNNQASNSSVNFNDIYKMLTNSRNPMETFNSIVKNNPKMAPVMTLLNNGYSPQMVFNAMCQQRGINPQDFIKNLTR